MKKIRNNKKYKVCLMGASFTTGNMGVSALAAASIKLIIDQKPNAEITFVTSEHSSKPQEVTIGNKKYKIRVVNFRLSPKARLSKNILYILSLACIQKLIPIKYIKKRIIDSNLCLKTLNNSNMVGQIRGGDSFSDIYGLRRLIYGLAPSFVAILIGKKHVLLPQTYGPYGTKIAKVLARQIIKRSSLVLSRDKESIMTIQKLFKNNKINKKVSFCPDVAFMLDSVLPERIDTYPSMDLNQISPLIGINVSGLLYSGGYNKKNMFGLKINYKQLIYDLSLRFIENTDASILYVPHTWGKGDGDIESDPFACNDVMKRLYRKYQDRLSILNTNEIKYDQSQLKGIIGLCDFFIGSRMHSCIAAISQGIPTIGIAYSKKFFGVFDSGGVGDQVIDARVNSEKLIIDKIFKSYIIRFETKEKVLNTIPSIQNQVIKTFATIVK